MDLRTRERAKRIIVGSLISSNMSPADIYNLAMEFQAGSDIAFELGVALHQALSAFEYRAGQASPYDDPSSSGETLYWIAQSRRLPKKKVLNLIRNASRGRRVARISESMTVRQMLDVFAREASQDEIALLLSLLQSGEGQDPYLKGIVQR